VASKAERSIIASALTNSAAGWRGAARYELISEIIP
jgi:hypothetical protein